MTCTKTQIIEALQQVGRGCQRAPILAKAQRLALQTVADKLELGPLNFGMSPKSQSIQLK